MSLNEVTFAASAIRNDGRPTDQRIMAMATIAAVAWSTENALDVLCILYVVLAIDTHDRGVVHGTGFPVQVMWSPLLITDKSESKHT